MKPNLPSVCAALSADRGLPVHRPRWKGRLPSGLAGLLILSACGASTPSKGPGWDALEKWDDLPILGRSTYLQFSSHDRLRRTDYPVVDPGNKDLNNFLAVCGSRTPPVVTEQDDPELCDPGLVGHLIARVEGRSGFVSRLWFGAMPPFSTETLRIYADDLSKPAYEGRPADWVNRKDAIFAEPLAGPRSGGLVSYVPIPFRHDLRILMDGLNPIGFYYYQADVQLDEPVEQSFQAIPLAAEERDRLDALLNTPGSGAAGRNPSPVELALHPESTYRGTVLKGPGTIRKLGFAFDQATLDQLRSWTLEIRWDGEEEPSIRLPLSAFFGVHLAIQRYVTLPYEVQVHADRLSLSTFFPMPFEKSADIRLVGTPPPSLETEILVDPGVPARPWGYFGAAFSETVGPFPKDARHPIVSLDGWGKYVGTFLFMEGHKDANAFVPDAFNFLEGDERGVLDGELRIAGTGTEDYINAGWYFLGGLFDSPFAGLNVKDSDAASGAGRISAYRWHVLTDEINFNTSFDLSIEYGANRPDLADRYASVAYYYSAPR